MKLLAALAAAVLGVCTVPLVVAAPASARATPQITMTVSNVDPTTPAITTNPKPVVFTLTLVNNTDSTLTNVTIDATRADPIGSQAALDASMRTLQPPSDTLRSDIDMKPPVVVAKIAPSATTTATFATTMGSDFSASGICECNTFIYPIYFTASTTSTDGARTDLAHAETYVPSFTRDKNQNLPQKTRVAWVWPLLDRPHRLRQDNVFTDDLLAPEISLNGRLDKLLTVLEQVSDTVPMTVVTDPDLIDSLAQMSKGYRYYTSTGIARGSEAESANAASWLTRLRTVLTDHPDIELAFTAYADPAVDALTRSGLSWTATASTAQQQTISDALGTTASTDITWPVNEQVTSSTLTQLARQGTSTIVLRDTALTRGTHTVTGHNVAGDKTQVLPDALAALPTTAGTVTAAVTSSPIETLVRKILTSDDATAYPLLPRLVAQLAIRVVTSFDTSHFVVITPPRDLTVEDPAVAARTIRATSNTSWSEPLPLRSAVTTVTPVDHGALTGGIVGRSLPADTAAAIKRVQLALPVVSGLFADTNVATRRLGTMLVALQRCEATGLLTEPALSRRYSSQLDNYVNRIMDGVEIVKPGRPYTLTSDSTDLPITVINNLSAAVTIEIQINPTNPEPNFHYDVGGKRTLAPGQHLQFRVTIRPGRAGTIPVNVELKNANGDPIDASSVPITIRSTPLGGIGVIITIAAAVVLALAVIVRLTRRGLHRRREKVAAAA